LAEKLGVKHKLNEESGLSLPRSQGMTRRSNALFWSAWKGVRREPTFW